MTGVQTCALPISSFAAAVALHFLWDWMSLSPVEQALQALRASALMLVGLLLWRRLMTIGLSWSQAVFAPSLAEAIVEDREDRF